MNDKSPQIEKSASEERGINSLSLIRHLKSPYVHAGLVGLILFLTIFYFNWNVHSNDIERTTSLGHLINIAGHQRMLPIPL